MKVYGKLVWYHVPTNHLWEHDAYADAILKHGASIPIARAPKLTDAFKRGTQSFKYEEGGIKLFFKDAGNQKDRIERILYRRNVEGKKATDVEIARFILKREAESIEVFHTDDVDDANNLQYVEFARSAVQSFMDEHNGKLYTHPVREGLRSAIEERLHGIAAKPSGSVYFVPGGMVDELNYIIAAYNELDSVRVYSVAVDERNAADMLLDTSIDDWFNRSYSELESKIEVIAVDDTIDGKYILKTEQEIEGLATQLSLFSNIPGISAKYADRVANLKQSFDQTLDTLAE